MRFIFVLGLLAALSACRTSRLGACTSNAQCPLGSTCDTAAAVCVISACTPACDSAHLCTNGSCLPAGSSTVVITSPAANAFVAGTLQATATASAPGGVASLRFDLSRGGSVIASATGTASPGNPSNFSASIPLTSVADGPASLTATIAAGNVTSAPVTVLVDQTAPVITLQTDGRTAFFGAGQTATVVAQITDAVSGVQDSTVALLISGHAAVPGVPGASGTYSFPVLIDDTIVAAGVSATLQFQLVASNQAGQPATLSGDPAEVIQADRDAPSISLSYPQPSFTDGAGHVFLGGPAGGFVSLQATITDGAGVTALCLRLAGETGPCQHTTTGTGPVYTFSLPRPAAPQDGTAATTFTLEADDALAAKLSGPSQREHQTRSTQIAYFDYAGPSISVSADSTPYARTATPIPVSAFVADPSGVPDGGVLLNGTQPTSRDGGLFLFRLDPLSAPPNVEGTYTFQVSARDNLNNAADAGATRVIDDAPPAVSVRVFKGSTDPGVPGVTYPALVANTGWTGITFVYSDTVRVKGTINDLSGIGAAVLHVDGIDLDGGVAMGAPRSLGCAANATSCTFDVQVTLNDLDAGNGVFHTGMSDAGIAGAAMPVGFLSLTIDASDDAGTPTRTPAIHKASTASPARTTRFLWAQTLPGSAVSGLAVHPDGDIIATIDGGAADTVFDLAPDQLLPPRWSYGRDAGTAGGAQPIGPVIGPPAIGTGGSSARIYVASADGNLFAIEANGTRAWAVITPANLFTVGPAVAQATISSSLVDEVIEPDGVSGGGSMLWRATGDSDFSGVASDNRDFHASPLILNGSVFFASQNAAGTTTHLTRHSVAADGSLGASVAAPANGGAPYYGLITDGTNLFAATNAAVGGTLQKLDQNFNVGWTNTLATAGFSAEPTLGIDARVYASDFGKHLATYDPANGGTANVATLANVTLVPLQGSDGHIYLPRRTGFLYAYAGSALSWFFDPPNEILREATMDCSGRLFVASGPTIYAFVTDDHGLADTAWPAMRRDSRNTGNSGLTRYGSRTISGCTQ